MSNLDSQNGGTAHPRRPPLFVAPLPSDRDGKPRIRRVLIANRGEIACRIIATCRKLNLTSIAVYAEEDARSRHVDEADEAINLGSIDQEGGNPFLNIDLLIKTAVSVYADAVHPGYGYLSENATFSDRVKTAGLIFIGPSSNAILTLGDKRASKDYLREHESKVPLIPGFAGTSQNVEELEAEAAKMGFPVMIKASAGGGGRGIRIVHKRENLASELERAQSEAQRSFGSSDCILEKYIEAGKHVEIQIIGDSHGKVVSLWERECSVQRRHQKIIEETPCPWLTPEMREEMSAAAVRVGELIGYENAGTVEFVVDVKTRRFYFLEVNSRLQVEHPITEEVTGLDAVSLQLFVAAGGSLASLPILRNIPQNGHAIECRLCAEDPQRDFYPEHGTVRLWQPASQDLFEARDVRFETAIKTGSAVTIFFDSMIAKVVVWAPTRSLAISRMATVLANTVCAGVKTNQLFLQSCLLHKAFRDVAYTTSFIPENLSELLKNPYSENPKQLQQTLSMVACLYLRNVEDTAAVGSPPTAFRHIRKGFRNQSRDPVNVQCDIVTVNKPHQTSGSQASKQPLACIWKGSQRETGVAHQVHVSPIPTIEKLDSKEQNDDESASATNKITAAYNALSNSLRSGSLTSSPPHHVTILQRTSQIHCSESSNSWVTGTLALTLDSHKLTAHIATTSLPYRSSASQSGRGQSLYVHFPHLGTHYDATVFDPLSYIESLRVAVTGGASAQSKTVMAPMPCKVLRVLKKAGQEVKAGEIVMVVESMKMEINIVVSVGGKLEVAVSVGDAVDEGKLLCRVV